MTIRLVIGFSRGSASDQIARAIAPALERALDRTIAIELRPGNNGADAACAVAGAKPDGTTVFIATLGTHALAPHLNANLPYDAVADFAPISLLTISPLVLACHASTGVSSARELIDLARSHPGELTYGTSAIGGAPHVAAELFCAMAGVAMKHVRYARTERLYEDLEAARIALTFNNIMSVLPRCQSGAVRALAVTGAARTSSAGHLPTLSEAALPGYEMSNWLGVVAPKATPTSVIDAIGRAIATAVRTRYVQDTLLSAGVTPCPGTPCAFGDFIERELARWRPVVARFLNLDPFSANPEPVP